MNTKQSIAVVSSYSDISKFSAEANSVHFRKFVSRKVLKEVMKKCKNLEKVFLSKHLNNELNEKIIKRLNKNGISIAVSKRKTGRPSLIERRIIRGDLYGEM